MEETKKEKHQFELRERGDEVWHSDEINRLPPMWPASDSHARRQMCVEFVG